MVASRDICMMRVKAFNGKQTFIRCCGSCASRFHLLRPQFNDTKYAYYTDAGVSTYKCAACVKTLRSQMKDDTSVRPRESDLQKKIVFPDRTLVLSLVFDNDKYSYEALSVQLGTVRLNGFWHNWPHKIFTGHKMKNLVRMSPILKVTMPSWNLKISTRNRWW
jgi:hypothetical protein